MTAREQDLEKIIAKLKRELREARSATRKEYFLRKTAEHRLDAALNLRDAAEHSLDVHLRLFSRERAKLLGAMETAA